MWMEWKVFWAFWISTFSLFSGICAAPVSVKVASINVLAPTWASPSHYPQECWGYLPWQSRFEATMQYISKQVLSVDALALQETEITVNPSFAASLGSNYYYFAVYHDDNSWANWITVDPPFRRNGVAIAVTKKLYDRCTFGDLALGTGNHAAIATCRHKQLNRWFRFVSVHLDSDYGGRRAKEAEAVADWFELYPDENGVEVVAGDFNADTDSGVLKDRFTGQGFFDVLRAVGINQNTHPWTETYNRNSMWGNIDHVLVRGSFLAPLSGKVYDSHLFGDYPIAPGAQGIANEVARICLNFKYTGTDHFPVHGVVSISPLG